MTRRFRLPEALCLAAALSISGAQAADGVKTVGRVRVVPIGQAAAGRWQRVSYTLESRFAGGDEQRLISLRPRSDDPERFDATVFDYRKQQAFEITVDATGRELTRREAPGQPARTLAELADAYAVVGADASFAEALAKGELQLYEAMPPVTVDASGRRLVNVGVMSTPRAGQALARNEIVSVDVPTGRVVHYESGAPETARAGLFACGPGSSGCGAATGSCGTSYQVSWPASDPVWKFNVSHPSCSQTVQGDGTGLVVTDVYYRGKMVLKRGEVPVLNVLYAGNSCGPYRDWLYSEDCFQASGTDVGSGIRVASSPPSTLCESEVDSGNFKGTALYDEGDALWVMSETNAGWYRYVMEWRFRMDGTIEPIFGFGATSNNCTCNEHDHHAYWRFEWAVDAASNGTVDDPATGINTLERHHAGGGTDDFDPIPTEGSFVRLASEATKDTWRIKNPQTGSGYIIQPGALDGTAEGDAYAKWDLTALALNPGQIDDPNADTSVNVAPWVSGESLGATKRLVTWYHATYFHDDPGGGGEPCELAGPKLVPLTPCAGTISLDRAAYGCSSTVSLSLNDSDLRGAGTATVTVSSTAESTPEPVVLTESPAGSGHFTGSIATTAAPALAGDGALSVSHGDTIHAGYLDDSACGTPNVPTDKPVAVDCMPPSIQNVAWAVSGTTATIDWQTDENATGIVHFGTTIPTGSAAAAAGSGSHHTVIPAGLAECTTYYFWLESVDAAGNIGASNSGGGYYALRTGHNVESVFTSTDTPRTIPDNNPTGVTSTIPVAAAQTVQDVNATVNITHTWDSDLSLSLVSPAGSSVLLSNRHGGSDHNYVGTIFDDEAATPIGNGSAPFTGSFRPDAPLAAVDGQSSGGSWRLRVIDHAGQDIGTIDSWQLALTLPATVCAPNGEPPPTEALTASRADPSTVQLGWSTAACPATNYHLLYGSIETLPTYALSGAICGLGPLGSYAWPGVPSGNLWFVVVADDASSTEGTWGQTEPPGSRNGASASGLCGFTARTNATCP